MDYEITFSGSPPLEFTKIIPRPLTIIQSAHPQVGKSALWKPLVACALAAGHEPPSAYLYDDLIKFQAEGTLDGSPLEVTLREIYTQAPSALEINSAPNAPMAYDSVQAPTPSDQMLMQLIIWHPEEIVKEADFAYHPDPHRVSENLATLRSGFEMDSQSNAIRGQEVFDLSFSGKTLRALFGYAAEAITLHPHDTVIVDHPETYLTDNHLRGLADLMAKLSAASKISWVVETSTPVITQRLKFHIASGLINPNDYCGLYVTVNHPSKVHQVILNTRGDQEDSWPEEEFDLDLREIMNLMRAQREQERKKK